MIDTRMHVIPNGDLREHTPFDHCWCSPYEDDGLWIHRSMDRREEYEEGRKPS